MTRHLSHRLTAQATSAPRPRAGASPSGFARPGRCVLLGVVP
jgi:hypothetical protein